MKKILSIILLAGFIVGAIGCKGSGTSASANGNDSTAAKRTTKPIEDSLSQKLGELTGANLIANLKQSPNFKDLDKDQFLKAFETIIALDTTQHDLSYIEGMNLALKFYTELLNLEKQGVSVNRQLVLKHLKDAFNSKEGFDDAKLQTMQGELESIMGRIQDTKGKENLDASKKYIDEQMKKDKNFKKASSGVVYKIVEPGSGETFKESSTVDIKLLCKDIKNNVLIDQTSTPTPLPIAQMKQDPVFGKLYDIIKTMKPGAKLVAIIPGDQLPTQEMGIAPNMALVFEITTVGISSAKPQAQAGAPAQGQPSNVQTK